MIYRSHVKFHKCQQGNHIQIPIHSKLIFLLKSCKGISDICQIHAHFIKSGLDLIPFNLSKLLSASIKNENYAHSIFTTIQNPNLFMFNTMLRCYSTSSKPKKAIFLFCNMRKVETLMLDQFSYITTLKSCAREFDISSGKCIHSLVLKSGFVLSVNLMNTLLNLYCAGGQIEDAHTLFDEMSDRRDSITWNCLMNGYLQISRPYEVTKLFKRMIKEGLEVIEASLVIVLSAMATNQRIFLLDKSLQGYCVKMGFLSNLNVMTALINRYAKSGCMDCAKQLFDILPERDVVLWNCIIDGYSRSGMLEEAVVLLYRMKQDQLKPDSNTLVGLLSVCASSGLLLIGRCVHEFIKMEQIDLNSILGTCLIDMYSKSGSIDEAIEVFEKIPCKDVIAWTAMITGLGLHGRIEQALHMFSNMEKAGVEPNKVTFLAVLNACSHGRLISECKKYLNRMIFMYRINPEAEHYGCVIDLLGRAGKLKQAHKLISSLPIANDISAWRALLAGCRIYGNVELAECVQQKLRELDRNPSDEMLLLGTYVMADKWNEIERVRYDKKEVMIMKKETGVSSIEING